MFGVTRICFYEQTRLVGKKNQFEMEKRALILYLLNLIFEFFALLHFMCLLFLQCARHHFEFSLSFRSYQTISMKP